MTKSYLLSYLSLSLLVALSTLFSGCVGLKISPFYDVAVLEAADGIQIEASPKEDTGDSLFDYLEARTPSNCFWMVGSRSHAIDERLFLCCSADSGPVCKEAEWYEKKSGPGLR